MHAAEPISKLAPRPLWRRIIHVEEAFTRHDTRQIGAARRFSYYSYYERCRVLGPACHSRAASAPPSPIRGGRRGSGRPSENRTG